MISKSLKGFFRPLNKDGRSLFGLFAEVSMPVHCYSVEDKAKTQNLWVFKFIKLLLC